MPCNMTSQYNALNELNRTLRGLDIAGFGPLTDVYKGIYKVRAQLLGQLGLMKPKATLLVRLMTMLSPGSIKLFYDSDSGWFTDARVKDGAPPVYHHVSDETAMAILRGELSHELEAELMKPDGYLGE